MTALASDSIDALVVLAAAAHPDDIEFMMAGTLLRLRQAGCQIHMWNLADGSCGTSAHAKEEIIRLRWEESKASANIAGSEMHPPLADDFKLYYEPGLLAKVAAGIRTIRPNIILAPSPLDYMEDHQNACRLLITAAFVRGMRNFETDPPVSEWNSDLAVYHAMPHGLRDNLRRLILPEIFVDISPVLLQKCEMLAAHKTQKEWLDASQGMDSYLNQMKEMSRQVGRMSARFQFAEGWRRHNPLGFGPSEYDPLSEILRDACFKDSEYEKSLG